MYSNSKLYTYSELTVWQKSVAFASLIYKFSSHLPTHEQFGLISQMQRAAVSIPSNIAEGYDRNNRGEFIHFLGIAYGSSAELETQLFICKNVHPNIDQADLGGRLIEIRKMLKSLINKLKTQQ